VDGDKSDSSKFNDDGAGKKAFLSLSAVGNLLDQVRRSPNLNNRI